MQHTASERAKRPRVLRRQRWGDNETLMGWLFILPVLAGVAVFTYGALVYSFFISLTDWDLLTPAKWTGFSNYGMLLRDEEFYQTFGNTLFFVVTMVPIGIVSAMTLAILIHRPLKGAGFFRASYYLPHITSTIAIGVVWLWIFNPDIGSINTVLSYIGIDNPPRWLESTFWAKPALVLMRIWQISGYYMILYLAGLQTIPDELYEAASIDGASPWQKTRYITVPLLANTTFIVTVLLMIESFNIFEAILALTKGGPGGTTNSLLYYIYTEAFQSYRMGYASALAWVLFFILFVLTLIQFWHRRKSEGARM